MQKTRNAQLKLSWDLKSLKTTIGSLQSEIGRNVIPLSRQRRPTNSKQRTQSHIYHWIEKSTTVANNEGQLY